MISWSSAISTDLTMTDLHPEWFSTRREHRGHLSRNDFDRELRARLSTGVGAVSSFRSRVIRPIGGGCISNGCSKNVSWRFGTLAIQSAWIFDFRKLLQALAAPAVSYRVLR